MMPDLKDLLRPLDDEPMPDRWERIRSRPVEPLEDPSRRRRALAIVTAGAAAFLVVAVIAALGPLGGGSPVTGGEPGTEQPPAWLVDAAYREAYGNGDLIPDSARWTLLPRSAIPTPVGPIGAGDPTEDYVVVLHGNFVGYTLSAPAGASLPRGSVLSIAYDANTHQMGDLSLGNDDVNLPGLQPFTLPGPEDRYTSPQGWSVALPPGWQSMTFADNWSAAAGVGAVISNHGPETPVARDGSFPQASSDGFPSNGITLVIARMNGVIPAPLNPKELPLSYDAFGKGSAAGGSTLDGIVFAGPDGEYTATVRTGPDASAADLAAIRDVVASLTFSTGASTSLNPSSTTPAALRATQLTVPSVFGVATTANDVWLASYGHVLRVDRTDKLIASIPVPGLDDQDSIAASDSVWVTAGSRGEVIEIDPSSNAITAKIPVPGHPGQIAADPSGV
jgi:hypothetical protein